MVVKNRMLVRGKRFNNNRVIGNPVQAAEIHSARGVDELLVLDTTGPDFDFIGQLIDRCWCPVTVGGGIKSVEDVRTLLNLGADKVCICREGSAAVQWIAGAYGSQAVMACINSIAGVPVEWSVNLARSYENAGAGEILIQDVERDGTMEGYNLDLIRAVSEAVSVPVIASSGCSGPEDMLAAIRAGASAVAAGALFAYTDWTPVQCARFLAENKVEARIP